MVVEMPDPFLHCPRDDCEVMHRDPLGDVDMGDMLYFEETVGAWFTGGEDGEVLAICVKAPWVSLPCVVAATGTDYLQGQIVYFDVVAEVLTILPNAGANPACGRVRTSADAGDTRVEVNFNGMYNA